MSSLSRLDDMFVSLPTAAKIWIWLWSYLAVSGWFSTYMLISKIGETRRNNGMIQTMIPEEAFMWTVIVIMISSLTVIGLFFYGRYARKKKDVAKAALKKFEETNVFVDPKMRFDPAVIIFWIGGSVLNVLFTLTLFTLIISYTDIVFDPPILYALMGFCISFFSAVVIYLITQFMANGILDAKAVKKIVKTIVGSDETRKVVGAVCSKLGIADKDTVNGIYEKVKNRISAAEYKDLTPDEVILINRAIAENEEALNGNMGERENKGDLDWMFRK